MNSALYGEVSDHPLDTGRRLRTSPHNPKSHDKNIFAIIATILFANDTICVEFSSDPHPKRRRTVHLHQPHQTGLYQNSAYLARL